MARYDVFLLNSDKERVRQLDQFSRLELIKRFNAKGSWLLETNAQILDLADVEWQGGIRVLRDGDLYFEGMLTQTNEDDADLAEGIVSISGSDYMYYLETRLTVCVPSGPPYSSSEYDTRSGAAGDVMQDYVRYHLGSLAKTGRVITGITVAANAGYGSTVTGRGRFQSLLEMCQQKALEGGDIGFRFNGSEFEAYVPRDQTALVTFSRDRGTLSKYKRRVEIPKANYIIAGGTGEGTARNFTEAGEQASINQYGRIEWFYDYRNADGAELYTSLTGKLAEQIEKVAIEAQVQDTEGIQFLRDYDLGDRVTVRLPHFTYTNIIREVRVVLDGKGETVFATVATPNARPLGALTSAVQAQLQEKEMSSRVSIMARV